MTDLRWRRVAPVAVLAALAGLGLVASPAVAAPDNDPDVSLAAPSNIICWETPDPEDPCDVTIVLSIAVNVPVIVEVTTVDGTATARRDYAPFSGRVIIPAGAPRTTLELAIVDDGLREPDEVFGVWLTGTSTGRIGIGRSEITIRQGSPPGVG